MELLEVVLRHDDVAVLQDVRSQLLPVLSPLQQVDVGTGRTKKNNTSFKEVRGGTSPKYVVTRILHRQSCLLGSRKKKNATRGSHPNFPETKLFFLSFTS